MSTWSRSSPASTALARSSSVCGHSLPWISPPMHFSAAAAITPSGVPPMPTSMSTPVFGRAAEIAPATSPSEMKRMRAPVRRISSIRSRCRGRSSTRTVTSATPTSLALATRRMFSADGSGDVDGAGRLRADRQLLHVEHRRRVVHRAPFGDREHGQRVRHALAHQRGAVDGVDRDVAVGAPAVAHLLAVEQHGRLVLLALADHDDAAHGDGADELAHRVDRCAVAAVLVAAPDPAARRHRGRLGDTDELHREVAVRGLPVAGGNARSSRPLRRRRHPDAPRGPGNRLDPRTPDAG